MTEPMTMIQELKTRILNGGMISREEALALYEAPLEELCSAARQIQLHFCQNRFDLCTITVSYTHLTLPTNSLV